MKDIIIINCSKTKKSTPCKAIDMYCGKNFKQLINIFDLEKYELLIISAKYGLLNAYDIIEPYDCSIMYDFQICKLNKKTPEDTQRYKNHYLDIKKNKKALAEILNNQKHFLENRNVYAICGKFYFNELKKIKKDLIRYECFKRISSQIIEEKIPFELKKIKLKLF